MDKRASYATMIWGVQGSWVNSDLKTREDVAAAALFSMDADKAGGLLRTCIRLTLNLLLLFLPFLLLLFLLLLFRFLFLLLPLLFRTLRPSV